MTSLDDNGLLQAGKLPSDPEDGTAQVSAEAPRVLTAKDLLVSSYERALAPHERSTCVTGHYELDRATGGPSAGMVWVFGADTNWGKSSWVVMVADENLKAGRQVLIVSSEDDQKIYGDRLLLRRSRVPADRFRAKRLTPEDHAKLSEATSKGEQKPLYLDARGRSVEWVAARTKEVIREHGIELVAFDYLQAFDSDKRHQDRRNQVSYVGRVLTDVAKLSGCAGIICSQITVDSDRRYPDKHSIKESRDISNAAEVVVLGFTASKAIPRKDGSPFIEEGEKVLHLDKNKAGPKGMWPIKWDNDSACFDVSLGPDAQRYQEITGGQFDTIGDNT